MAERVRRKSTWSSLSRFEQMALVSSILIWAGVVLFGGGLYIAFRNLGVEKTAYAGATVVAVLATQTAAIGSGAAMVATDIGVASTESAVAATETIVVPTETLTPSPTPRLFPAGWATATPMPTAIPAITPQTIRPTETPSSTFATQSSSPWQPMPSPTSVPLKAERRLGPPPASKPPDRLVIPTIELDSSIIPVGWHVIEEGGERFSVWQVADYAVGWHQTSAYPGHTGNIVLNGHHNIRGEVFRYLVDLDVGDEVRIHVGGQTYGYKVVEKHILKEKGEPSEVRQQNARWIAPTEDERLTMVTCWPYTNNTHRLVVVAKPAPSPPGLDRFLQ